MELHFLLFPSLIYRIPTGVRPTSQRKDFSGLRYSDHHFQITFASNAVSSLALETGSVRHNLNRCGTDYPPGYVDFITIRSQHPAMRSMKRHRQFSVTCQFLNGTPIIRLARCFNNQLFQFIGFRLITPQVNEALQRRKAFSARRTTHAPEPHFELPQAGSNATLKAAVLTKMTTIATLQRICFAMKDSIHQELLNHLQNHLQQFGEGLAVIHFCQLCYKFVQRKAILRLTKRQVHANFTLHLHSLYVEILSYSK